MKLYLESIVESNTLVDAITGKPVRMDIAVRNLDFQIDSDFTL